jgi:hypothetical protein
MHFQISETRFYSKEAIIMNAVCISVTLLRPFTASRYSTMITMDLYSCGSRLLHFRVFHIVTPVIIPTQSNRGLKH